MADDDEHNSDGGQTAGGDQADTSHGPQECMPCHGTGRVISNLGGEANKVTCPWCAGEGTRQLEIDAQARWVGGEAQAVEAAVEPPEAQA